MAWQIYGNSFDDTTKIQRQKKPKLSIERVLIGTNFPDSNAFLGFMLSGKCLTTNFAAIRCLYFATNKKIVGCDKLCPSGNHRAPLYLESYPGKDCPGCISS